MFIPDSFNSFSAGIENASTLCLTSAYLKPRRFVTVVFSVSPNWSRTGGAGFMEVALEERRAIRRRSVSFCPAKSTRMSILSPSAWMKYSGWPKKRHASRCEFRRAATATGMIPRSSFSMRAVFSCQDFHPRRFCFSGGCRRAGRPRRAPPRCPIRSRSG